MATEKINGVWHVSNTEQGGGGGGGGTENAVLYTAQTPTSNQQEQARTNIAAGTYSKPSGGIPSSDMATAVQTSLGKADTAYQKPSGGIPASDLASGVIPSVPVTDVTVGGTSVVSNGKAVVPAIPTVPTISTDIAADKASTTKTAAPSAVYNEVHPATASSQPAGGMLPNVLYKLGTLTGSVTIAFATPSDNTVENEYKFTFTSDSTAPTITWPAAITKWAGNALDNGLPDVEASTYYEVSVVDGAGIFNKFE